MARKATFEDLKAKRRRKTVIPVRIPGEDGTVMDLELEFQAIPTSRYDELVAEHPPTDAQRKNGNATWNGDTFPQALVAEASFDPKLTYDQVDELFKSPDWSGGEQNYLYLSVLTLQNQGLDVPFSSGA